MKQIRLSKKTVRAIAEFINSTQVRNSLTPVSDAEFEQDGCMIYVDYEVYADYVETQDVHSEVPYNQIEDLSCWIPCDVQLKSISAFDEDGDQLEVTQRDFNAVHSALAVA